MIKGMFELKKHRGVGGGWTLGLMRAAFRDFLTAEGLEVAEAADGAQALDIFDLWQPDLVFMDYVMPVAERSGGLHPFTSNIREATGYRSLW